MNPITAATSAAEAMFLAVTPSGGQRTARRNALAEIRRNDAVAHDRAAAAAALASHATSGTTGRRPAAS